MDNTDAWRGKFGDHYTDRNNDHSWIENNKWFFIQSLKRAIDVDSFLELGANVGFNIKALKQLYPDKRFMAIEVNEMAFKSLNRIPSILAKNQSLLEPFWFKADLVFTKGVLIHIHPSDIELAYEQIYNASNKYILIAEYYNPTPTVVSYRGYNDMLFKRDFAGDMLEKYSDLSLIDYGFRYHLDLFPQSDITWFLLKKRGEVDADRNDDAMDTAQKEGGTDTPDEPNQ